MKPLGLEGRTSSIADLMIDLKIPRDYRAAWPLLLGQSGVAWLVGYRQDEATKVRADTRMVLRVIFKPARTVEGETDQSSVMSDNQPVRDGIQESK